MKKRWKRQLLTDEQEKQIVSRIGQFEAATGGELVLAIHRDSGPYPAAGLRFALLFTAVVYAVISFYYPLQNAGYSVLLALVVAFIGTLLGHTRIFTDLGITHREMRKHVHDHSLLAFQLYQVHETDHRAGCLFYLSLTERKFVILLDKHLHEKLPQTELSPVIAKLTSEFSSKRQFDGIMGAIQSFEDRFRKSFPEKFHSPSGKNQLRDTIRWSH